MAFHLHAQLPAGTAARYSRFLGYNLQFPQGKRKNFVLPKIAALILKYAGIADGGLTKIAVWCHLVFNFVARA
jgi:hypothetical protein